MATAKQSTAIKVQTEGISTYLPQTHTGLISERIAAGKALRATVDQVFWALRDVSAEMK